MADNVQPDWDLVLEDIEREIVVRMRDAWIRLHHEDGLSPQMGVVRAVVGECGAMLAWAIEAARSEVSQ